MAEKKQIQRAKTVESVKQVRGCEQYVGSFSGKIFQEGPQGSQD